MPDDTVTTSWQRFTDKVKTSCGQSLHASLAATSGTTRRPACPTDHNGEAICQAARLANWEDEGGTTVFAE